jgi:hypothetical protein
VGGKAFRKAPIAAVMNYSKLTDWKQHKFIILRFWMSKSNMGLAGLKST